MTRSIDQIVEDFIGSSATSDLITESYEKESEYIKWLAANFLPDDYSERDIEDLFDDKYLNGACVNQFLQNLAMTEENSSKFYHVQYQHQDIKLDAVLPENKLLSPEVFHSANVHIFDDKDFQIAPAERFLRTYMEKSFTFATENNPMEAKDIIIDDLRSFFDYIPSSCDKIPLSDITAVSWSDREGKGGFVLEKDLPSALKSILLRVQPDAALEIYPVSEKEVKKFIGKTENPTNFIAR